MDENKTPSEVNSVSNTVSNVDPTKRESDNKNQAASVPPESKSGTLNESLASALCYLLGFVTGIIFILVDKRDRVRFNAAQSIVIFGGVAVLNVVLNRLAIGGLSSIIGLTSVVLWVILIYRSYKNNDLKIEFISGLVESITGKKKKEDASV